MYNLFSNVINDNICDELKSLCKSFGRTDIFNFIKKQTDDLFNTYNTQDFENLNLYIYQICENLRCDNLSYACEIYITYYYSLTRKQFDDTKKYQLAYEFLSNLNLTEIYYNLANLLWGCGNSDDALLNIFQADAEYSKHENKPKGALIKFLLNSEGYILWNFIGGIYYDFHNYGSKVRYNIEIFILRKIDKQCVSDLLNSFNYLILLQFINSINRIQNFTGGAFTNDYKSIRQFKLLGELSWLFECYLKDKYIIEDKSLYNIIEDNLLKTRKDILKKFKQYDNINDLSNLNKISKQYNEEVIDYLLIKLKTEQNLIEYIAICLRVLVSYRNYSAHHIDNKFFLFDKNNHFIELYIAILGCFFIGKSLIEDTDKNENII